ncbi:hypothetical protein BpHYR1_002568 [Brachionus plicatilis]|uniref:RNA-directed DNA polymerase from mobile element jockey-like n=1 Tax=Brachionus plicatilis TaxID=10195 RepID=A0A3M7RGC8_BRAPC|nr:hypothetical protein BpHYR1_002568 [Brachionus plicatilis]
MPINRRLMANLSSSIWMLLLELKLTTSLSSPIFRLGMPKSRDIKIINRVQIYFKSGLLVNTGDVSKAFSCISIKFTKLFKSTQLGFSKLE